MTDIATVKKKFQGAKCELVRFLDWRPINCFCLPQFTETSVFSQGVRVQIYLGRVAVTFSFNTKEVKTG